MQSIRDFIGAIAATYKVGTLAVDLVNLRLDQALSLHLKHSACC